MQEFTLSLKNFCSGIASDAAKREHLACENLLNMYVTPAGKLKHVNWIGTLDAISVLAVSDSIHMSYLSTYSGNVLNNDSGIGLVVAAVDGNPLLVGTWIEEIDGTLLMVSSDGALTVDAEEINSATTTFTHTYTISGPTGSATGTLTIQLSSVLALVSDSVSTNDATVVTGNVLDNDTGVGMYVLALDGLVANIGVAQTLTNGTVVTINSDGSYTIDPTGCDTSGGVVVDTIEYSVSNGEAEASAWLTVTVTASAVETDPYWDDVVLLIQPPDDAVDGSTVITDRSLSSRTISRYGNAQVDTSLGYPTVLLDGSGDYLTIPSDNVFDLLDQCTLEVLFRPISLSTSYKTLIAKAGDASSHEVGWSLAIRGSGAPYPNTIEMLAWSGYTLAFRLNAPIAVNADHHIEFTRDSNGVIRMYLNGVFMSSTSIVHAASSSSLHIGRISTVYGALNPGFDGQGHVRIRWTHGIARHTTTDSFAPPTSFIVGE